MILSRELGKRIWGGSTSIDNGGGGVSSDYIAGLLAGYATESWVDEHYISIDFFSRLFQAHGTENGSEIDVMPNDMDTTITSVESMFGFWTNLYISALGSNGAAPAGISLGMLTDVTISGTPTAGQVLTFDAVSGKWINGNGGASSLAGLTDVTLTSLASGQTLLYDSTTAKWYNSALKTINGQSLLGSGDISVGGGASGNYLPLTGGTLTGELLINNHAFKIFYDSDTMHQFAIGNNSSETYIESNTSHPLKIGFRGGSYPLYITTNGNVAINQSNSSYNLAVNGTFYTSNFAEISTYMTVGKYITVGGSNGICIATPSSDFPDSIDRLNNGNLYLQYYSSGRLVVGNYNGDASNLKFAVGGSIGCTGRCFVGGSNGIVIGHPSSADCDVIERAGTLYMQYYNSGNLSFCMGGGKVGIGVTAPSYALHVAGTIYATGAITALSDAKKKDITGETSVTVEQIAHAPAVQFLWKDKERRKDGQQVGTLAQYWQTVLPEVVMDKGGELSMQYGVAALVSAIVTARKVVDHERRICELEKENERLKTEVSQLRLLN